MRIYEDGENVIAEDVSLFSLEDTLNCGQCFRWKKAADGFWEGISRGKYCKIKQDGGRLVFSGSSLGDVKEFWILYFGLDEDYSYLHRLFSKDNYLRRAVEFAPGIRLARQDPWETLCTFIVSQNNNIPRIKKIIESLCRLFGKPLAPGVYSFPDAEMLARLAQEDLAPLRCGFRWRYLLDAAKKVACNEIDLLNLGKTDTDDARKTLMTICGVGPKVANCVLLYGFHKTEVVPMDVWMKRVAAKIYPDGFPQEFAPWMGIAQQYLFHYARHHGEDFGE